MALCHLHLGARDQDAPVLPRTRNRATVMRAVFGEDPKALRAHIRTHVAESVPFFLAAGRNDATP